MNAEIVGDGSPEEEDQRRTAGLQSAGARLQAARSERELSIEAVAGELRLSVRVVEALEAGDAQRLPGHAFVRGYVRSYARLVGLPEQPLLDELGEAQPAASAALGHAGSIRQRAPAPVGKWLGWGLALVALVLLVLYGVPVVDRLLSGAGQDSGGDAAQLAIPVPGADSSAPQAGGDRLLLPAQRADDFALRSSEEEAAAEAPVPPAVEAPAAPEEATAPVESEPPPAPPARAELRLRLTGDSWVEVSAGGRKLLSTILHAGSERTLSGQPPFEVLLGNAPAVEVEYNGRAVDTTRYRRGRVARFRLED